MDDGLNCGRNVPGITRQTNALSFYSLGNEVDKERLRTVSLIYKSIVIGRKKEPDAKPQGFVSGSFAFAEVICALSRRIFPLSCREATSSSKRGEK